MIITRFPSSLQRFFRPLRAGLSDDQFRHLWCLVVGLLVNLRAAKLSHLSAVTPAAGHRTRPGAFLAHGAWDAPALVERAAATLLAGMSPKTGEVVHLILDDNRIPKRARGRWTGSARSGTTSSSGSSAGTSPSSRPSPSAASCSRGASTCGSPRAMPAAGTAS